MIYIKHLKHVNRLLYVMDIWMKYNIQITDAREARVEFIGDNTNRYS